MIAYVSGVLKEIEEDSAIVDVGGIGYRVYTPVTEKLMRVGVGNLLTLHTYLCIREDAQLLYGFTEKSTLKLFQQLINVNGVGPKYALAILTQMAPDAVAFAIASGDHKALTKVSGIGPKTAQRIILDLKDKVSSPAANLSVPGQAEAPRWPLQERQRKHRPPWRRWAIRRLKRKEQSALYTHQKKPLSS